MRTKLIFVYSLLTVLLISCSGSNSEKMKVAVGGKQYGGELKFMSSEKIASLFPIESIDVFSQRVLGQMYEPLFKIDLTSLKATPLIAESFEMNGNASVYTIKIRKGVKFHEDDCFSDGSRELTAEDVKFSLDLACSGLHSNQVSYLLTNYIKGAKSFMEATKNGINGKSVSGIKVVDANTVKIELNQPFIGLEKILSHTGLSIVPKEAFEKYGEEISKHPVGTGPFMLEIANDQQIILNRNPNYWRKDNFGNQLPFLDKISLTYSKNKRSELMAFRKKAIDVVMEIPVEEIENILGSLQDAQKGLNVKHKIENESSMSMAYIAFACQSKEFKDENVRKAFNLAVDRQEIVNTNLEGEGYPALNGFVPPMDIYPNNKVTGHSYNVELAKELLAKAGYPNGKNFPALSIYVNTKEGSKSHRMVQGVVSALNKNLNLHLKIKLCTIKERDKAIASGQAKIWRGGWIADYPDPETFLSIFYGGNIHGADYLLNGFQFKNQEYDKLYEQALREVNPQKRNELMVKCDQLIIDRCPVMPILTGDFILMVNARIRDFKTNSMEAIDFSKVYIKEPRD
ncbi:MAG: ABC transporter substrate-binding protein [Fluviicola sp.]|jgi:oligopeptide transport system substrate-binding protein|nr:ABC transporter substrate-binding protein [Fluviicola sp.]